MMTKATQAVWTERVRAWRASGLDAEAFASGKGYAGITLTQRARELKAPAPREMRLRRVVRSTARHAGFAGTEPAASAAPALLVRVGTAEVVVGPGFDAALLRSVVRCLREDAS